MEATDLFRTFLGVLTTAQLLEAGIARPAIERAVAAGRVRRLRRGWFAWNAHPDALSAVARSGCVSCLTALGRHGAWLPRGSALHCRLADGQRDRVAGALKGCRPFGANPAVARAIDDVETAFRCALRCAGAEDLVAVADSLVHRRIATLEQLRAWSTGAPASRRRLLDLVDAAAESGTESMVRLRIRCRTQVVLWRGRRVDLLVGDRLIIECDSVEHHTDRDAYQRDRRYDRIHVSQGYLVVRLTWQQVHDEWPAIEQDILAIVRRGDHRWRGARSIGQSGASAPHAG